MIVGPPAPNRYRISDSIGFDTGVNSPYKTTKTAQVVFGKDKSSGID